MKKITCLIVDDEPHALNLVESYVNKTPFLELKGKCHSALEASELMDTHKIDLIFLDIQMPDLNGISFCQTFTQNVKIVFTTAFKDYAFDGFKSDAVDYLLKPFNYEEFLKATNKVKDRLNLEWGPADIPINDFIFVKSEYKLLKINLNEVYYFEGLKDYVKIRLNTQDKPILTLMSLKTLEAELPSSKFMRVHRSFIIALDKIVSIERSQVIINRERITVADQYKDKFYEFMENKTLN